MLRESRHVRNHATDAKYYRQIETERPYSSYVNYGKVTQSVRAL